MSDLGRIISFYQDNPPRPIIGELPAGYAPLPAEPVAQGIARVMGYVSSASRLRPGAGFLDCQAGDGRVVAVAGALGLTPVGLEENDELFLISLVRLYELQKQKMVAAGRMVSGNCLDNHTYAKANINFSDNGVVYSHTDAVEGIAERVADESPPGTVLLHVSRDIPPFGTIFDLALPIERVVTTRLNLWEDHYLTAYMKVR